MLATESTKKHTQSKDTMKTSEIGPETSRLRARPKVASLPPASLPAGLRQQAQGKHRRAGQVGDLRASAGD